MKKCSREIGKLALLLTTAALTSTMALAQGTPAPQQPAGQQPGQQQPGQQQPNSPNPQAAPLESAPPPVNAEEDAAIKEFREVNPQQDLAKKDQLAEQFVQKYPNSHYAYEAYNWLVRTYYRKGQVDKMEAAAEKQFAVSPNDPQTLALVGSTLPRAMNASTPDPEKRLDKAEKYCHKALELLPTIPKPENMTDEVFQQLKGQTYALAYSGLGLVAFRRGNYNDAIPELENAVKAEPQPDPVNYYILGLANEKASHFQDAVAAFTKCASIPGGIQSTCSQNLEEAKKLGATQLSAPK